LHDRLICDEAHTGALIERYVAGRLSDDNTEEFEQHLLLCAACQADVRLAYGIRKGLGTAESQPATGIGLGLPRQRRRWTIGAGIAAAAALALFVVSGEEAPETVDSVPHRAAPTSETAPVPISPVGSVSGVHQILWTGVAGADRFRFTLLDTQGVIAWDHETADTFVVVPPDVILSPGVSYYWKVDARVGFDRWLESSMVSFQITAPASESGR
jgi:Putative zinc-finger